MTDGAAPAQEIPATALAVVSASALETITRAEIDSQVGTARKYRRSLEQFKHNALADGDVGSGDGGQLYLHAAARREDDRGAVDPARPRSCWRHGEISAPAPA